MCRNCAKSKRECLGYDPIFKQQPGPAQIQPAPNSASAPHATSPAPAPTAESSTYSQSPVPQGYAPASSSGYAPAPSATSGAHPQESFNAIDPALAAPPGQGMHQGQPYSNGVHSMDPAMRGPPGANAYPHPPPPPLEPTRGQYCSQHVLGTSANMPLKRRLENTADSFGVISYIECEQLLTCYQGGH